MLSSKVYIIAELSANHNNNYQLAEETILGMKNAGADAVKFQTYSADSLSLDLNNEYFGPLKTGLWKGKRPYDLFEEASMPWEWQKPLSEYAQSIGLEWLSSPFDFKAVDFLEGIDVPVYKIASLEITDIPLIEYIAAKNKAIIISTGAAEIKDIEEAISACKRQGNDNISLLKCTSQYPAPIEAANLLTIPDMQKRFKLNVGLSDHSFGTIVPIVAVSLGAKIIEKHFTLSRSNGGPDSGFSLQPEEFKEMVEDVRKTEKALGRISYDLTKNDKLRRRSIFTTKDIKKGEIISCENVKSLRPGHGLHPLYLSQIIGKNANTDISAGVPFDMKYVN